MKKHYISEYWNKGVKGHLYYDFVDAAVNDDNLRFDGGRNENNRNHKKSG